MNFTREPIIETVITSKEGYKLVVRNSKGKGQEEFFVDAVEVISFGNGVFFRSLEKPKSFLVPVNDYEILEVREARMVLKTTSLEKGIKIGGGREQKGKEREESSLQQSMEEEMPVEHKEDKRRERRRFRKRKGKLEAEQISEEGAEESYEVVSTKEGKPMLIPPPPTLISETLKRKEIFPVEEETQLEEKSFEESGDGVSADELTKDEHIPF